ncbi:MAG: hypothetical protein PWR26_242 [Methanosarcinales archaeon]|uniref:metal-dependent hydrolase n=1 Tax=Methermicoccus shengliensis TaxID=660064 RepID=UPI0005B287D0|nr:metal-dependent hydrolase [Methermicoccus shengliensis]KUK04271.1 MAG: hypothetical protein XD46_0996 [Euryarchaeota archaeon 55_53]KUK30060.1 MAG: hypothetical protein XD62_0846 [Methanosarcinales archeaon 56_1174]MDI3487525.1 hypothetical protein [Methanosarcinales archaeon]MDN5295147.1 hypothetical protein [Methanosarcinales archaeon]
MILEHLIYSTAIAIVFGMLYRRATGREHSWLIVASAYAPDADVFADALLRKVGITVLVLGQPIGHGDFHNIAVLAVYATAAAFLLHPFGIKFRDSFVFAGVGFGAHLFEDALIINRCRYLWPLSMERLNIGLMDYHHTLYGIADPHVLKIGLVLLLGAAVLRTLVDGRGWVGMMLPYTTSTHR